MVGEFQVVLIHIIISRNRGAKMSFKNKKVERLVYIIENIPDWKSNPKLVEEVHYLRNKARPEKEQNTKKRQRVKAYYRLYEDDKFVFLGTIYQIAEYKLCGVSTVRTWLNRPTKGYDGVIRRIEKVTK